MQIVADDLLCPSCAGYVHPFLERCPACGLQRAGRFDDAVASGAVGAGALLEDETTQRAAHQVVLRYSLRSLAPPSATDLVPAFSLVAGSVSYRAAIAAPDRDPEKSPANRTLDGASLALVGHTLQVRGGSSGPTALAIPLEAVLAATPIRKGVPAVGAWVGAVRADRHLLPKRPLAEGELLVTFAIDGTGGQLALANRRGIFAASARPDHYVTLARWIGILAAAAAEARWVATGAAAHAAELGLHDPVAAAIAANPIPDAPGQPTGVRGALEELEDLRVAGLVRPEEYEAKRREILARL